MRKSEELRQEANAEDNDLKYMGLANKALREERKERFDERWLPIIKEQYVCIDELESKGKLIIAGPDGLIDYYPKANKLLIRKKNQWKKPGLRWLIKNLKLKLT